MNALEGGGESGMGQQDGGNHDEGNVVVVLVRERVGAGLEASEEGTVSSFKGSVEFRTVWVEECKKSPGCSQIGKRSHRSSRA